MRGRYPEEATGGSVPAELAITWLGHATVLIEMDGARALTDPVLRRHVGPLTRVAPASAVRAPMDCALLSDLQRDHTDLPTLRGLRRSGPLIVPPRTRDWLVAKGIEYVRELAPSQTMRVGHLGVTATRGRQDPRRHPFGPTAQPVGFLLTSSVSVYFAGDTAALPQMADLRGRVDVALLPIAEGRPRMGHRHPDPEAAAAAVALIDPSVVIPIQWGTVSSGGLPGRRISLATAHAFAAQTRRYAPRVDVRVLNPNERLVL
ncbi:MAG: MBL fold metallo-hydrolase [Solirubrobacteraceae bacterium]